VLATSIYPSAGVAAVLPLRARLLGCLAGSSNSSMLPTGNSRATAISHSSRSYSSCNSYSSYSSYDSYGGKGYGYSSKGYDSYGGGKGGKGKKGGW